MTNTKKEVLATPLIPLLTLDVPEDRSAANALWHEVFWEAHGYEQMLGFNLSMHPNPEYFLDHWSNTLLNSTCLRQDVWGWALKALRREQRDCVLKALEAKGQSDKAERREAKEYKETNRPHNGDMLEASHSLYFLTRFKEWAEARLAYHRAALKLTFYKHDKLAGKEPLASNGDRLRTRIADWRDARMEKQRQLFENDPEYKISLLSLKGESEWKNINGKCVLVTDNGIREAWFRSWLENKGVAERAITDESIDWLCWLVLVSPISRGWNLHEIALAILKSWPGQAYREAAKQWWANPPTKPTYKRVKKTDGFVERVIKRGFPEQFHNWRADWISKWLARRNNLPDKLRKIEFLPHVDRDVGRPASHEKPREDIEGATEDMEKDVPKGWLLAKNIAI